MMCNKMLQYKLYIYGQNMLHNNVNKQVKYDSLATTLQPLNIYQVALVRLKYITKIYSLLTSSLIKQITNKYKPILPSYWTIHFKTW
jgi:hypothetical protein